jgi:hypothetical protein
VKRTAHQSRDGLCEMRLASFFPVSSVRRTWFTCLKSRFVHPVLFTVTEPRCRRLAVGEDCKCPEDTPLLGAPGRTQFSACQASSSLDSKGSMRGAMAGMACEWGVWPMRYLSSCCQSSIIYRAGACHTRTVQLFTPRFGRVHVRKRASCEHRGQPTRPRPRGLRPGDGPDRRGITVRQRQVCVVCEC